MLPVTNTTRAYALSDGRRPSAGALLQPQQLADRLNIFGPEQLRLMSSVVEGVATGAHVSPTKDYSAGLLHRARGRTSPARKKLNITAWQVRQRLAPGDMWWADIGHVHPPDWRGDTYCRTFAEEHTGVVVPYFCSSKSTAALIAQLVEHETWVATNVPGGRFRVLRCDFGSEYAVQGRGDDYLTAALKIFCADRPDFHVEPCPPHAHAFNKVEGAIHQTAGRAFSNACRANLGDMAWSLLERGASYQHNVRPVWAPPSTPTPGEGGGRQACRREAACRGSRPSPAVALMCPQ